MKKLLFVIAALLPCLVFAQAVTDTFTIKSTVGKLNAPAKAFLVYKLGANQVVDSADIVNGSFAITGTLLDPTTAFLVIDHKGEGINQLEKMGDAFSFFLDKGTLTITTAKDSIYNAQITGSVLNDESKSLKTQLNDVQTEASKLNAEFQAAPKEKQNSVEYQTAMQSRSKLLQARQKAILKTFVNTHPDSYLSMIAISMMGGRTPDPAELEPLYNSLSPQLKDREMGKMIKKSIDAAKAIAIGSIAPDFIQTDANGNPVKLSSLRGKYVLIDFWASWCGPCRQENPNIVRVFNKYKSKNFTILGVSLDKPDAKTNWLNAIKNDGLTWTQVSDLKFWGNEAALLYSVSAIPANFLLDPNGKIVARDLRGSDLDDKLEELLGKI